MMISRNGLALVLMAMTFLAMAPGDALTANNLAWVLATSKEDPLRDGQRALELSQRACELTDYKQAHILSTLAASMGVALENARLFEETNRLLEETQQRSAELEILNRAETPPFIISDDVSVDEVLRLLVAFRVQQQDACQRSDFHRVAIPAR